MAEMRRDASTNPGACLDLAIQSPILSEAAAYDRICADMEDTTGGPTDTDLQLPLPLNEVEQRPKLALFGRKRTRDDYIGISSDPPLFSSDDVPESSENYASHRHKRRYKGTWWGDRTEAIEQEGNNEGLRRKREFKRTVDSGVWMGSDDTRTEEDEDWEPLLSLGTETEEDWRFPGHSRPEGSTALESPAQPFLSNQPQSIASSGGSQSQTLAYVQSCVENGWEEVDLSGFEQGEMSSSTLRPLRYLIRQTPKELPPSQEAYKPLVPLLRLYLANNHLHRLPGEIFNLTSLTALSVRQNQLTEIPASISKLTNLQQLNVSGNKLRWLPWEIRDLSSSSLGFTLYPHPNPFVKPIPGVSRKLQKRSESRVLAASTVAYLDISGMPFRGSPAVPSFSCDHHPSTDSTHHASKPWHDTSSKAPSLCELALRSCSTSPTLENLPSLLPDESPSTLLHLLKQAWEVKDAGGKTCSICNGDFIINRTEWIEWWNILCGCSWKVIPLIRRGCSWKCVPDLHDIPTKTRECGWTTQSSSEDMFDSDESKDG